jgi:hypothetical protein
MAVAALTTAFFSVAATTTGGTAPGGSTAPTGCSLSSPTDLAGYLTAVEAGMDVATLDTTTFGSGGYTAMVAGLKTGVMNLALLQDFAASAVEATIGMNGSVIAVGAQGFVEVRPGTGARSTTNPGFICKVINNGWRFMNATVGGLSVIQWNVTITGGFASLTA